MVMTWFMNSMNEKIDSIICATSYFFDDLDLLNDYEWKSTDDANHYKQIVEAYRIYKFLAGLNVEVSLPKISKVFAEVRRKESCRHVMLGKKSNSEIVESSVLSVAKGSANKTSIFQRGLEKEHSAKQERINRSNPKANVTINESKSSPFSKERMDHLKMLKSNSLSALNVFSCCFNSTPWIIDSRFLTYSGKSLVKLSENIDLKSVLHVPKLACNLCLPKLGKKIGGAKLIDGLYYFDGIFSNKRVQGLSNLRYHSSPTLNLPSIPFISSLDLDIPIALRKGTLTCTKYLIAKYLSYKNSLKLIKPLLKNLTHIGSKKHSEEMNALKRSGTWELVDLPKEKRTRFSEEELERLKRRLVAKFEIKDLGALKYFLGMEFGCKPAETPIESNIKLLPSKDDEVKDKTRSKASWDADLLVTSRPDIAFAISMVSRRGHLQVEAFTDANWAGSVVDERSTSGYYTFVGGNLVTWRSKNRMWWLGVTTIGRIEDLKYPTNETCCDNKTTILIAHNLVLHDRTKHVEVDKHFIKEKLKNGLILADVLSKGIPTKRFDRLIGKSAMEDIFKPT
ncbi:hypothetical protein AAG906_035555 [Vitis piasezkii]